MNETARLALAWVLSREQGIVPIPGTRSLDRLWENLHAVEVELDDDDLRRLEAIAPKNAAAGLRYPEAAMQALNR